MNLPSPDVFQRVKDNDEKIRLLQSLAKDQRHVVIRMINGPANSPELNLEAISFKKEELVLKIVHLPVFPQNTGEASFEFMDGDELYIGRAQFEQNKSQIILQTTSDLFRIQRRDDFRLRLSSSSQAIFQSTGQEWTVIDLSAGGFRLQPKTPEDFKNTSRLSGLLILKGRDSMEITAEVIHQEIKPASVGFRFVQPSAKSKNDLHNLVISLYRELFLRFKS